MYIIFVLFQNQPLNHKIIVKQHAEQKCAVQYLQDTNPVAHANITDPAKGRKLNYEELEAIKTT